MKKATVLMIVLGSWVLAACNTFEGVGKDIQKGGQAIERAADRSK